MKVETYKNIKKVMALTLAFVLVYAFSQGSYLLPLLVIGLYMAIISLLKTRVDGVLADERQVSVSEKASQVSFQILMPMLALTAAMLYIGGGNGEFYYIKALGIVLSYIVCLGLIIYLLTYWYFDRKSGGRSK